MSLQRTPARVTCTSVTSIRDKQTKQPPLPVRPLNLGCGVSPQTGSHLPRRFALTGTQWEDAIGPSARIEKQHSQCLFTRCSKIPLITLLMPLCPFLQAKRFLFTLPAGDISDERLRLLSPRRRRGGLCAIGSCGRQAAQVSRKIALNSGLTLRRMPFNQRARRSKGPYHCSNRLNFPLYPGSWTRHAWLPPRPLFLPPALAQ